MQFIYFTEVILNTREGVHSAEKGVKDKMKRYPPKHGKTLIGCAMETWGRFSKSLDALLEELAGLAGRRLRDRGVQPTKWLLKWRTQMSLCVALHIGRCILDALPNDVRNYRHRSLGVTFSAADSCDSENPHPGGGRRNTLTHISASGGRGSGEDRALNRSTCTR